MRLHEMMTLSRAIGRRDDHRVELICADALRRNPQDFFALMTLADTYWRNEQHGNALLYALRVLEVEPDYFNALRILAEVYAKRGERDRAYSYAKLLVTADPPRATPDRLLLTLLKPFSWVPKVRRIRRRLGREDDSHVKSLAWAKDYIFWYESEVTSVPRTVQPRWMH